MDNRRPIPVTPVTRGKPVPVYLDGPEKTAPQDGGLIFTLQDIPSDVRAKMRADLSEGLKKAHFYRGKERDGGMEYDRTLTMVPLPGDTLENYASVLRSDDLSSEVADIIESDDLTRKAFCSRSMERIGFIPIAEDLPSLRPYRKTAASPRGSIGTSVIARPFAGDQYTGEFVPVYLDRVDSWGDEEDWNGLVNNTDISIKISSPETAQNCEIQFGHRGFDNPTIAFSVPRTPGTLDFPGMPPLIGYVEKKIIIAKKESGHLFYRREFQGVSPDLFDHVRLVIKDKHHPIQLSHIKIKLNNLMILDQKFSPPLVVVDNYDFDDLIRMCRWKMVNYSINPVLYIAKEDYAQAWNEKYKGWWEVFWCSEFAGWVINKALGWDIPTAEDVSSPGLGSLACGHLFFYFSGLGRMVIPRNTPYKALGLIDLTGSWVGINHGGHSTLFVSWCNEFGDKLMTFNPDNRENYFLGIGGNQSGGRVSVDVYHVINSTQPKGNTFINWITGEDGAGYLFNSVYIEDGFGITSPKRPRIMIDE